MKTVLHYYRFNLDEDEDPAYTALCDKLRAMGLKKFDSIADYHSKWYKETIKPLDGQEIELETAHIFDNQWNTAPTSTSENGLRVFDWAEAIYPNRRIKEGQWLEQTDEMREIRKTRHVCGYCGAQYDAVHGMNKPHPGGPSAVRKAIESGWCTHCLGSEYLKESELYLLKLLPAGGGINGGERGEQPPEWIIAEYHERQRSARTERLETRKADKLAQCKKTIENAQREYEGFRWLIEHDMDFDNVIFYDHTQTFCFGWRQPIPDHEERPLRDNLADFPFKYEIK